MTSSASSIEVARIDGQRIQPELLPAIVEPVEKPEMMAGGSDFGENRAEGRGVQSGQHFAAVGPENSLCHGLDADHFPVVM